MSEDRRPTQGVLERALRSVWGPDTCAPEDRAGWSADNPAWGQCITTVLIVHDLWGGRLVRAAVHRGGRHVDFHWWNRLPDGSELDLTRVQFRSGEQLVGAETFDRPADGGRVREQYLVLRERVLAALGDGSGG